MLPETDEKNTTTVKTEKQEPPGDNLEALTLVELQKRQAELQKQLGSVNATIAKKKKKLAKLLTPKNKKLLNELQSVVGEIPGVIDLF